MGAPKLKWTAEEEAALKAGVRKHGTGKWRTILSDPEFGSTLRFRSNVDLKDKWRNINVTSIWGSRHKAKQAVKRSLHTPKLDAYSKALAIVIPRSSCEPLDAKPLTVSAATPPSGGSRELPPRLDMLILEAINALKEPNGSDKESIALYIEGKYSTTHNLRKLIAAKLKLLTSNGRLSKVKRKYRTVPNSAVSEKKQNSPILPLEGKKDSPRKQDKSITNILTKSHIEQELSKIRGMTEQEAAAAAAKAVAEAEAAIAEAEEAAREAEAAEVEAEAAHIFFEAAVKAFKYRLCHAW